MPKLELIYVFTSASLKGDSVQAKVIAQINAMNKVGLACKGLFFTTDVALPERLNEFIEFLPVLKTQRKYFNEIKQKRVLINTVKSALEKLDTKNKFIYLRYPGASYELYKLAKNYKDQIISEHLSKEIIEIKSYKNEFKLGIKPTLLLSYFQYQTWPIWNEKIWGIRYRKLTKLTVVESNELGLYQRKQGANKFVVIPNGIETEKYKKRSVPEIKNEINLLFLKGASTTSLWNGIDRLINSIDAYSGEYKINLYLCGKFYENELPKRSYIKLSSYQQKSELDTLFNQMHLGISAVAIYLKDLNEIAVLKTREYLVRGLPFVYGYEDPDIETKSQIAHYCLQVANNNSLINFHEIFTKLEKIYKNKNHASEMHEWSKKYLDWEVKMQNLLTVLISISSELK